MTWYDNAWTKRKPVTLNKSLTGSTLTDFPVHVPVDDVDVRASARADTRDVLFTASDGTTKLDHELVARRRVSNTSWSWFSDPRALYDGNGKLYVGGVDSLGNIIISQLVLATGLITSFILSAGLEVDDHDAPAIYILASGRIVAFYCKHNDGTGHRYRISTSAGDISAWGSEQIISNASATYHHPILLNSTVYLFCRNDGTSQVFYTATEANLLTNTWSGPTTWFTNATGTPYARFAKNGTSRIDVIVNERAPNEGTNHVGHFYLTDSGGTPSWFQSDGTPIGHGLPLSISDATIIYNGSSVVGYIDQVAIDANGKPCALYSTFPTPGTDLRYNFSRWTGSAWSTPVEITPAGSSIGSNNYYQPGICFDGNSVDKVYLAKTVSQHELQQWETGDSGATWSKTADITSSTPNSPVSFENTRPFSPIGHNGKPAVIWLQGRYTLFTDYNTVALTHPPIAYEAHVRVPSYSSAADTALYCYYGNSAAIDQSNPTGVWDSGFMCVMHMGHKTGTETWTDSTTHAVTGTPITPLTQPGYVTSQVWEGAQFTTAVNMYVNMGSINFASLTAGTLEFLVNYDGTAGHNHDLYTNATGAAPTSGSVQMRIAPSSSDAVQAFMRQASGTFVGGTFDLTVSPGAYHHVSQLWDSSEMRVEVDGTVSSTSFSSGGGQPSSASVDLYVGYDFYGSVDPFLGIMDEIRISNVRRNADWLAATTRTLKTPASYITWGTQEALSTVALLGAAVL